MSGFVCCCQLNVGGEGKWYCEIWSMKDSPTGDNGYSVISQSESEIIICITLFYWCVKTPNEKKKQIHCYKSFLKAKLIVLSYY